MEIKITYKKLQIKKFIDLLSKYNSRIHIPNI